MAAWEMCSAGCLARFERRPEERTQRKDKSKYGSLRKIGEEVHGETSLHKRQNNTHIAMNYKNINNYMGWGVFIFASVVYCLTIEPTTSLWDCGEYITTSYKLEVGHPPGAPIYSMLGRLFSMFAAPENAAMMINLLSAFASSFTILFLFWTITMIAKRIVLQPETRLFGATSGAAVNKAKKIAFTKGQQWAVLGAGLIGSTVYTFTDSFWFSAVEGEVYALSSFFTAIVFWAIFKWDAELQDKEDFKDNEEVQHKREDRWLVFIFFMIGLSIGVHLLNLLCIPAIAYVIYFRKFKRTTIMGFVLTGIIGVVGLGLTQSFIIPKTIEIAGALELAFVNSLGLPFNSGAFFFFLLLIGLIVGLLYYSRKTNRPLMNTITWCASMIWIGYSCFAMIVIRSNADTPLDENNPENLVSFQAYLQREQYGDWPISYGQFFTAELERDRKKWEDRSDIHLRKFVVIDRRGKELKGFETEEEATAYAQPINASVEEKYYRTFDGTHGKPSYDPKHSGWFPRMYSSDPNHINGYKEWSGHTGNKVPTAKENLTYFGAYQVGWMYWRYFMWNFAGRQSDEQGHGGPRDGNWISGWNFIDKHHIGDQTAAPKLITENPSHNKYYLFPLILGLMGFVFTAVKAPRNNWIVLLLFVFTGLAIIVFLNQKPFEPRERDYAFVASFYAFAIYIGLAVLAMYDAFKRMVWKEWTYLVGVLFAFAVVMALANTTAAVSMAYMAAVIAGLYGAMIGLRKVVQKDGRPVALLATLLLLFVPLIMGMQSWDDHDRSNRYTARALAYNYLISCDDNGIIYTNGDNDTFPLWYLQEVEGIKTSVRVCNLSLLNTDWYTEQMARKAYDSEALPISFSEEQYRQNGTRDYLYVLSTNDLTMRSPDIQEKWRKIIDLKIATNPKLFQGAFATATAELYRILSASAFPEKQPAIYSQLPEFHKNKTYYELRNLVFNLLNKGEQFRLDEEALKSIRKVMTTFNDAFDYLPAKEAMAYLRDDANVESRGIFILPTKGLYIPVDREKVLANGTVTPKDKDRIVETVRWRIPKSSLFKADLMVLDMVAHFDWERPIYFAGSASTSTYLGLNRYFYAEGLVYKLVPIDVKESRNPNSLGEVHAEKMYENLMQTFEWGNMGQEGVLVDYYTRRLTNNYRVQFSVLADAYAEKVDNAKKKVALMKQLQAQGEAEGSGVIQTSAGSFDRAAIPTIITQTQQLIDSTALKVTQVLNRSFEVMPEFNVPFGRVIPSYISSYYIVGDEANAEKYATIMSEISQEEINYYTSVEDPFKVAMIQELYSTYRGFFSVYQATQIYSTNTSFKEEMAATFTRVTADLQREMNAIRNYSPKTNQTIQRTFDPFFKQINV